MKAALLALALLAAPVAHASQFDGLGIRWENMAVGTYGSVRDGVRAWRRNAYGVDLDWRFTGLWGPGPVRFGAGIRLLIGTGGQFSEEVADWFWWDIGGEATLQVGVGEAEKHLVLEGGWSYRRDPSMGEPPLGQQHEPPVILRARGRLGRWGGSVEWATGRHVGAAIEKSISERNFIWFVVRPEYVRYDFKVDEGTAPTYGTQGLKLSLGVAIVF